MSEKLSKESAQEQIKLLFDNYNMDPADIEDEKKANSLLGLKNLLEILVMNRQIEVKETDDGGVIVEQHLQRPPKDFANPVITYAEICGKHKIAMKDNDENDNYGKIHSLMGAMSGLGGTAISQLKTVDMSAIETLGAYFLAV